MVRYSMLIVALVLLAAGCASGGSRSVPISDVTAFTGHYSGWITSPTLSTRAVTAIRPDGTFTVSSPTAGTVDVSGTITVKDGKARYETVAGRPAGIFVVPSGTMALSQSAGRKVLDGTSDDGKVTFQFRAAD